MNDFPKINIYEIFSLLVDISKPCVEEEVFDLVDYVLTILNEEVV